MTYTLLSATALGYDLVRSERGEYTAEVLLAAISSTAETLTMLSRGHPGQNREHRFDRLAAAMRARNPSSSFEAIGEAINDGTLNADRQRAVAQALQDAPLGTLDNLMRLVHHEIFDWVWSRSIPELTVGTRPAVFARGIEVLVDAAVSAYCSDMLDDQQRAAFEAGYQRYRSAVRTRARTWCDASFSPQVTDTLNRVATLTPGQRQAWVHSAAEVRQTRGNWSQAMHHAAVAAQCTDRVRSSAAVQLRLVQAMRRAGFTSTDAAHGSWNVFSGIVCAQHMRDVLDDDDTAVLLAGWDAPSSG